MSDTAVVDEVVVDRGDLIQPAGETVEEVVTPAEEPVEEQTEEPPRDAAGKFTKKDKGDDEVAKPIGIPKTVFDERIGAERAARLAAEARANALEAKIAEAAQTVDVSNLEDDIFALEKQHSKLMMEGEGEKAAEVMRDIRLKEREVQRIVNAKTTAAERAQQAQEQAIEDERNRVKAVVTSLEEAHEEFNDKSERFNQKLVNFVLAEQMRLINEENLSPSVALQRAADDVMDLRGDKTSLAAATTDGGKDTTVERKAAAVAKNVAAAKAQPGSMKEVGLDSDKAGTTKPIDVERLSVSEFDALPESVKSRLRGDTV